MNFADLVLSQHAVLPWPLLWPPAIAAAIAFLIAVCAVQGLMMPPQALTRRRTIIRIHQGLRRAASPNMRQIWRYA